MEHVLPISVYCLALLPQPPPNQFHTKHAHYDKLSAAADMGANQTVPEKVEHEASSTCNAELYGLFSSLGKVADSQEEQKVGQKLGRKLQSPVTLITLIRSKSSEGE
jgi:hypothetical protein